MSIASIVSSLFRQRVPAHDEVAMAYEALRGGFAPGTIVAREFRVHVGSGKYESVVCYGVVVARSVDGYRAEVRYEDPFYKYHGIKRITQGWLNVAGLYDIGLLKNAMVA